MEPIVQSSITILLVEDEPTLLNCLKAMLEREGHSVIAANSPGNAIELAKEHGDRIHLIIADVVMPEMNGRELVNQITSRYPNLKHLFMTAYSGSVIAHHGVLDEEIHLIRKPFSREDLLAKMAEVLAGD